LLQKERAIMTNIDYTLAVTWGFVIVTVGTLLSAVLWMLLFALIFRYSLDDRHLRMKLFGIFCIASVPYQEIKDVQVVPWWRIYWKADWHDYFRTHEWVGYEFRRTRVLITTNRSWFPYVLIAPADPAAFATALSARIPKTV
jgi:hypothetical protein